MEDDEKTDGGLWICFLSGRGIPGEVSAHAVDHQLFPAGFVAASLQCLMNGGQQRCAGVSAELEPCSFASGGIPWLNSVVETSSRPDNGDGPIFQAVHLVESARF